MKKIKANKGITLIALVVTIIVLLILAAVTINLVLGQNGIIGKANQAKNKTAEAEARDQAQLEWLDLQSEAIMAGKSVSEYATGQNTGYITITKNGYDFKISDNGTIEMLRKIDAKYIPTVTSKITTDAEGNNVAGTEVESGTPLYIVLEIELQEGTVNSVTSAEDLESVGTYAYKVTTNGTYKFSIITNKGTDNEYATTNTVEVEKIKIANVPENWINTTKTAWGYSYKDMSSSNQTEVAVNEPSLTSEMTPIKYVSGSTTGLEEGSKWANAMTPDGSMWVWIPRYAYKITSGEHGAGLTYDSNNVTTEAGTIDVIFLKDKTNKDFNGNDIPDGYTVHPTFTTNANAGGGWSQELEGIWVAKFEASSVEGNSNSTADNVTTKTLQVKPNVSSWRNIQIGNMYTVAKNAKYGLTDETQINNLNSHMMKNSEWGAVAYLSHSKYGRNGTEISINNSSDYYTGRSAGAPSSSSTSKSSEGTYQYNTPGGVLASTTGNVYGIYDMSGGTVELVASYVNNGNSSLDYGSSFATKDTTQAKSSAYVTVYSKGTSDDKELNYNANSGMKGDGLYETSKNYFNVSSWFSDFSNFPYSDWPIFSRGGMWTSDAYQGAFYFGANKGSGGATNSFRPVLVVF